MNECPHLLVKEGALIDYRYTMDDLKRLDHPGVNVDAITSSLLVHAHIMRAAARFRGHRRA